MRQDIEGKKNLLSFLRNFEMPQNFTFALRTFDDISVIDMTTNTYEGGSKKVLPTVGCPSNWQVEFFYMPVQNRHETILPVLLRDQDLKYQLIEMKMITLSSQVACFVSI